MLIDWLRWRKSCCTELPSPTDSGDKKSKALPQIDKLRAVRKLI
jgi:hypothetical protein